MWIVYSNSISFEVPTEDEAIEYCDENTGFQYMWKGVDR